MVSHPNRKLSTANNSDTFNKCSFHFIIKKGSLQESAFTSPWKLISNIKFQSPDIKTSKPSSCSIFEALMYIHTQYKVSNRKKMYPQLEKTLKIQRRVISFHLDALVKSEFGLTEDHRPQAVRYYSITPKGKDIFERLLNMLNK
jgi:DNA-binding HxlR family transcriptional regulator